MTLLALALLAALPPPADDVEVKTQTLTFTASHLLTLFQGRIYWKPRGPEHAWELFPPAGVPIGENASWPAPQMIDRISADGDNLIAVGGDGRIYYSKLDHPSWTNVWGPALRKGPLAIDLGARERIAISHRKIPFEDIDGNPHDVTVGVTTLFILSHGGRTLEYTDPWLPPEKRHPLCLPEHGQFRAAALSASASTVFVMDLQGRSFTRLVDFDILGLDPVLRYGWDRKRRSSGLDEGTYSLPPSTWREQPPLPGPATTEITIFQTGRSNTDRELRVGAPDGYWKKAIDAAEWEHVSGPPSTVVEYVRRGQPPNPPIPVHTKVLHGTLDGTPVMLDTFAPDCPPATLVIGDARLPLHFLEDFEPDHKVLLGALYDDGHHLPLFHGRDLIEVRLEIDADGLTLVEQYRPRALALELKLVP